MQRSELRDLARYWLDDLAGGYFTDAQMNVFLNNAQREAQKKLIQSFQGRYLKQVQTTTVLNQAYYVLPSDFMMVNRILFVQDGTDETNENYISLEDVTVNQLNQNWTKSGDPYYYAIVNNKFRLSPIPDSGKPLRMTYTYEVTDMSNDTDVPDVPTSYQELVALFAARDGFVKDNREPGTMLLQKIADYEKLFVQTAQNRKQTRARGIIISGDDFGPIF